MRGVVEPLRPGDPRQVGPYRLERRLGGGGMGQVYLGSSRGGRQVAVKVVRPELADDDEFRRRFAVEVEAARQVGGFYTAQVVDAAPDADPPWLVTAYIPGPSLRDAVAAHGPLPMRSVLRLGAGLAEGLAAVHAADLVHRDLKPANVLLAADGPRVIDFGIARALHTTSHTVTGAMVGSPAFMSPEQLYAEDVDQPSDVFTFGAVLTFAATGRGPFGTDILPTIMYRIVHKDPDLSGLPAPLADLVGACLAKKPGDRPAVDEIIDRLATPERTTGQWLPPEIVGMIDQQADEAGIPAGGASSGRSAEAAAVASGAGRAAAMAPPIQRAEVTGSMSGRPAQAPPAPAVRPDAGVPGSGKLAIGNLSGHDLEVLVDGAVAGTVRAGGQRTFPVAPGVRTVQVAYGARRSARWPVEAHPGTTARLAYHVRRPGAAPEATGTAVFSRTPIPLAVAAATTLIWPSIWLLLFAALVIGMGDIDVVAMAFLLLGFVTVVQGVAVGWAAQRSRLRIAISKDKIRFSRLWGKTVHWNTVGQVSVIGDGPDAELVIWRRTASSAGRRPIVCKLGKFGHKHNVTEIRGALRWFAGDRYVERPE